MEQNKSTQQQIEKTLQSIDKIGRAGMPPFFYTRLQAQLDKRSAPRNSFWMVVTRPAVSLVTLSLLVILNIAAINYFIRSSKKNTSAQSTTGIEKFAEEFGLGTSAYTDKTTEK